MSVVQPDAAKWGGITGCSAVAREVVKAKKTWRASDGEGVRVTKPYFSKACKMRLR